MFASGVRGHMRHPLSALTLLALVAGCGGSSTAPAVVRPTLAGIEALGLRCGAGVKDDVPSGLFQWRCTGSLGGAGATVLVDGNDEGVAGVTLVADGSTDPEVARASFGRLVDAVPPLSTAPILVDQLDGWTGDQRSTVIGGVRVSALCDATQCLIWVMPAADPLRPLPLP